MSQSAVHQKLKLHDIEQLGFDSVLVAVGAQGIKWLNIDGSEAGHIYDAKQLVYHYNQLPPYARQAYPLGQRLTIIGAGNVAIDIAHWAVQQNVETVTLLVRRGPNQVKYTKKEIKLIGGQADRAAFESGDGTHRTRLAAHRRRCRRNSWAYGR